MTGLNLPLSDRAGKGALEEYIQRIVKDMRKASECGDTHEFEFLGRKLDQARKQFHTLYNVKEHPVEAPIKERRG